MAETTTQPRDRDSWVYHNGERKEGDIILESSSSSDGIYGKLWRCTRGAYFLGKGNHVTFWQAAGCTRLGNKKKKAKCIMEVIGAGAQ